MEIFKLENEGNYHLLLTAAFAWIWKCRREELVFVIIHSWQTIINSDGVVYNQSREFSVPEDMLERGTSQGEQRSRWTSWGDTSLELITPVKLSSKHTSLISYSNKCTRNSIFSTYGVCHLTVWGPVPLHVIYVYRSGLSACVTRAGVMQESAPERINHLWKQLCQCGSRWQPEGS